MRVLVVLLALCGVARADAFDPEGWTLLANTHASATQEIEVLVPAFVGKVDRIAIVSLHGSAELVSVEFENSAGKRKELTIGVSLEAGGRSHALRIPRRTRKLWVVLGEGTDPHTHLAVLGKGRGATSSEVAEASTWDATGWEQLATVRLDAQWRGELDPESVATYDRVALVPSEDLIVEELELMVDDGTTRSTVRRTGIATWRKDEPQLVELPDVQVTDAELIYAIRGAYKASVTLYGFHHTPSADELVAVSMDPWVADGWTLIGEDDVDLVDEELAIDRDGTWRQVAIVAAGDDLHVDAVAVDQKRFTLDADLDPTSPSRVLDLTGKRRAIAKVRLQYTKHRLDASTRVKVYAR